MKKLNTFYVKETDHFKKRSKERGLDVQDVLYSLRDHLTELYGYRNLNKDIVYNSHRCSIVMTIKNKTIILKTILDKKMDWVKDAIVM